MPEGGVVNSSLLMTTTVLILVCAATPALPGGYTWDTQKGPNGSWSDPNHWSPEGDYPSGQDDGASIDNDPSVASSVTLSSSNVVNWIQISANQISLTNPDGDPDQLNLYDNLGLVASTTDDPPLLDNDGILYLDSTLHFQEASIEADFGMILGSGVLRLGPSGTLNGTFSNGPDHVIEGRGRVGFESAGPVVLNRGVIRPKLGMLRVSGTVKNTPEYGGPAVLRGDGEEDSHLHFDGATLSGGSIEAVAGPVTMQGATFSNLTISDGTLRVNGTASSPSKMGRGISIAEGAELRLQGNSGIWATPKLLVRDEQYADPITIQNEGVIALDGLYTDGSAELKVSVPDGQSPNYVTFAGSGSLLLGLTDASDHGYGYNYLSADPGAGYIQLEHHSILGYGVISAPLLNIGRVTAGRGGALTLQEDVTNVNLSDPNWQNGPFGTLAASPGARLQITGDSIVQFGDLQPDGGTIAFGNAFLGQTSWGPGDYEISAGSVLQLGGVTTIDAAAELIVVGGSTKLEIYGGTGLELVNNGEIAMDNSTELRQRGNDPAILSGNGTIRLGVAGFGSTGVSGDAPLNGGLNQGFINGPNHTIRGVASFSTNVVNHGEVIVENGYLTYYYPFELSGPGNVQVINDGYLNWSANLGAHDFTMDATGSLWVGNFTPTLVLSGNYSFSQTDEYKWLASNSGRYSLTMTTQGDSLQTVEVGGSDFGETGYVWPNFDLNTFTVSGPLTRVQLVDAIDNGNRTTTGEALYVQTLSVLPGATLDLNCLALYTSQSGAWHKVLDGGGELFGGGDIIDTCGSVGLTDVIKGLQLLTGSNPADLNTTGDVNDDNRFGLEEVLYYLNEFSK